MYQERIITIIVGIMGFPEVTNLYFSDLSELFISFLKHIIQLFFFDMIIL